MQDNTTLLRVYRKALARVIGTPDAVSKFDDLREVQVKQLLLRLLRDPANFDDHIGR